MKHDNSKRPLSRRAFLFATLSGSGAALLAACGSGGTANEPAAPAATSAPAAPAATAAPTAAAPAAEAPAEEALPQGGSGKLTVLHRTEYFEEVQTMFRQNVEKFAEGKGVPLDISTANPEVFGDFMAKMQAAVRAGVSPDLGYHTLSIPQMYSLDIVEDVTDVVETLVSKYGAIVPVNAEKLAKHNGRWYAVPFMSQTGGWFGRKDVFEAAGIDVLSLDTYDKRRDAALQISDPSKEMWGWGITINRSGDGHGFIVDVLQAFGASFTDETGMKVTFNTPEAVEAVKWLQETYSSEKYKPILPPGVESWTDTSNNEAFLAGKVALTLNQFSVYAKAKEDNNPIFPNIALMHKPKTKTGELLEAGASGWMTIFKGSKNVDLAKELILHMVTPEVINPMVANGGALFLPAYKGLWTDDILAMDPNYAEVRDIIFNPNPYNGTSHPAEPNAIIDGILAASIPSQMMSNVINGQMTAEEAVKDAHDRIVQLFEEAGVPQ